ncbi:beta-ketoacyl synthase N-terminal-like domain-containing protein [Streptomyces aidingensis]|uniref:Minimal PKS chain-length factor (CLF/KS beta) n=1 Tax=Streptomyces aidingensis TaxID=910347 RepID=A0A1I1LCM8_9ACTN|nr:beta-ketoacyl synthase N-terminal-like domain-containing protein [Streptomyces aidingensis]SFC70771.1 minimal PKS chain-length factor (CLF/KS beta) [Streptomyces aidingensis]
MTSRVVVTGLGVVAPTGVGVADHWAATLTGSCRISELPAWDGAGEGGRRPPFRSAGQVPDFEAETFVPSRVRVQTDRWTWLALAATQLAFADAALDPAGHDPYELSVVTAGGSGGNEFGQREIDTLWRNGPHTVSAYQSIGWFYAASSGQISIRHQLKSACGVLVADGAGGIDALASAARQIRRGVRAVVTGGTESPLSPYALACQAALPGLSTEAGPADAYRPFAGGASGQVPGEGGAMLIVEDAEFARERGAPQIYAEVAGTAATHDGHHPVDPADGCGQLARAMRLALERAGCTPAEVDVVFADGAGEPRRDALEAAALREVFGARRVPVTVPKTMTGRLCSGGAALDLAWAALALAHDTVPPSACPPGTGEELGLDLVTEARPAAGVRTALVVARGLGGFNSAAVLRAPR